MNSIYKKPIFCLHAYIIIIGLNIFSSQLFAQRSTGHDGTITIDFLDTMGRFKPVNGVNGGPFNYGMHSYDITEYHAQAGFSTTRLHDANWPHPDVVDVNTIFPIPDADPDDPNNYLFKKTDDYIAPIIKNGSEVIYRLGVSIEHYTKYFNHPPQDYDKWAKVCVNIIKHYNEGWADGFKYNIKYWEVWNEPDITSMWSAPLERYFELYEKVSKAIKAHDPSLKVGGPAATDVTDSSALTRPFLKFCRDKSLALDFFSWHLYPNRAEDFLKHGTLARNVLNEFGFNQTESFVDEWHYMTSWKSLVPRDSQDTTVRASFSKTVGVEAAAFAAAVLIQLQDYPIDMANFYCADYSPWSMFDTYGIPSKVFFSFKAFNELVRSAGRVACKQTGNDKNIVVAASLSDSRNSGTILVSNPSTTSKTYSVVIKNFPVHGDLIADIKRIDRKNNLGFSQSRSISAISSGLKLNVPANSVCLIKLKPTNH